MKINEQQLLEELSRLEHEQWMTWAQHILETENISKSTRNRWQQYFAPYDQLPEDIKELDKPFAQKSLEVFKKFLQEDK